MGKVIRIVISIELRLSIEQDLCAPIKVCWLLGRTRYTNTARGRVYIFVSRMTTNYSRAHTRTACTTQRGSCMILCSIVLYRFMVKCYDIHTQTHASQLKY